MSDIENRADKVLLDCIAGDGIPVQIISGGGVTQVEGKVASNDDSVGAAGGNVTGMCFGTEE